MIDRDVTGRTFIFVIGEEYAGSTNEDLKKGLLGIPDIDNKLKSFGEVRVSAPYRDYKAAPKEQRMRTFRVMVPGEPRVLRDVKKMFEGVDAIQDISMPATRMLQLIQKI